MAKSIAVGGGFVGPSLGMRVQIRGCSFDVGAGLCGERVGRPLFEDVSCERGGACSIMGGRGFGEDAAGLRVQADGQCFIGYGYNGYGFAGSTTQITQLGYPAGLDNAAYMERNDSYGYKNSTYSSNTIIGSNMNGGSSGGPWLVNFGIPATLTGETNGSAPSSDVVVGVTSWGYTSNTPKEQGAAPFTSGNIVPLVSAACTAVPGAC